MKQLFLVFILFLISIKTLASLPEYDFRRIEPNSKEGARISEIIDYSINLINEAKDRIPPNFKKYTESVIDSISNATYMHVKHMVGVSYCNSSRADFFVSRIIKNTVYLCMKPWDSLTSNNPINIELFSQSFIHEGVHLINIYDECEATRFEFHIMKNTRLGLVSDNSIKSYSRQCDGFKDLNF